MNREIAKHKAKEKIKDYLLSKGININSKHHFRCLNPMHPDKKPSMSYDSKTYSVRCWSECNTNYDIFDLVGLEYGLTSDKDKFKKVYEMYNIEIDKHSFSYASVIKDNKLKGSQISNKDFLTDCSYIFKNAFNQKNAEVKVSWDYLTNRGYSDEQVKAFNLGYLPNENELLDSLTSSPYNYNKDEAKKLMNDFFGGALNSNKNTKDESKRSRIAFTWYDKINNVSGFTFRVSTNEKVDAKYFNNNGFKKNQSLFNINNYQTGNKKQIVIVEGSLDALAASYLSSKCVQDNYHFVAMGGNSLSEEQVILLKSRGVSEAILFIDNDVAGDNKYESNIKQLLDCDITASIARIPSKYEKIKDIDELLRKHPEDKNTLMQILSGAQKKIAQIKLIKEGEPIDLHQLKRDSDEYNKLRLNAEIQEGIASFQLTKELMEKAKQYNDLLSVNYEEDNAYTNGQFLQDLQNAPSGLKTGFAGLDSHVSIQPSTLNFVAGRPSHGKTTVMLNMLRNMIRDNPDKAFMFYSYEETHVDIMSKIILSCTKEKDKDIEASESSYFAQAKNHLKEYAVAVVKDRDELKACASNLHAAYQEVENWINDGRLHIMTRKPNVESLSTAIVERVLKIEDKKQDEKGAIKLNGKKLAAIFIDYVQKLNCEEDKNTRQQELHKVCKDLLNTACDKRVEASIIMGAQANREVKSLETFLLENMREAGDIEQDANVVIGVWDEGAGTQARLQQKLAEAEDKAEDQEFGKKQRPGIDYKKIADNIKKKQEELKYKIDQQKTLTLKVLKNRNGKNNFDCTVESFAERFKLEDKQQVSQKINMDYEATRKGLLQ